jgi:alkaline phosphatase
MKASNERPQVIGTVRTLATDNLITDSAASGTAFACGVKSYNDGMCSLMF